MCPYSGSIFHGLLIIGLLFVQARPTFAGPHYDMAVRKLQNKNQKVQKEGEHEIVEIIKKEILTKEILGHDPQFYSEHTFAFGHFISSETLDVAIGVSFPPYTGNLLLLTKKNGAYISFPPITGIAFIRSLAPLRLFKGPTEQLVLNLYGGGSGKQHWGKDIYQWDGTTMRLIWAWLDKDLTVGWKPTSRGTYPARLIKSDMRLRAAPDGAKAIITKTVVQEGPVAENGKTLKAVITRREFETIHYWDEGLFYYVSKYGEITVPELNLTCRIGIPPISTSARLQHNQKFGILEIPGYHSPEDPAYHAIIAKESFCEIPKSAAHPLPGQIR